MTELALLNQDISRIISEINDSNDKPNRHLRVTRAIVEGNKISFRLGIGRNKVTWHTIYIYSAGWNMDNEELPTADIVEQVMHNEIYPEIPDERVDIILTETPALSIMLARLREESGLSLRQLAEISGVGYTHIQRIEHGHDASLRTINKLLSALGKELTIQ